MQDKDEEFADVVAPSVDRAERLKQEACKKGIKEKIWQIKDDDDDDTGFYDDQFEQEEF